MQNDEASARKGYIIQNQCGVDKADQKMRENYLQAPSHSLNNMLK